MQAYRVYMLGLTAVMVMLQSACASTESQTVYTPGSGASSAETIASAGQSVESQAAMDQAAMDQQRAEAEALERQRQEAEARRVGGHYRD